MENNDVVTVISIPNEFVETYNKVCKLMLDAGIEIIQSCDAACTDKVKKIVSCYNMCHSYVAAVNIGNVKAANLFKSFIENNLKILTNTNLNDNNSIINQSLLVWEGNFTYSNNKVVKSTTFGALDFDVNYNYSTQAIVITIHNEGNYEAVGNIIFGKDKITKLSFTRTIDSGNTILTSNAVTLNSAFNGELQLIKTI